MPYSVHQKNGVENGGKISDNIRIDISRLSFRFLNSLLLQVGHKFYVIKINVTNNVDRARK